MGAIAVKPSNSLDAIASPDSVTQRCQTPDGHQKVDSASCSGLEEVAKTVKSKSEESHIQESKKAQLGNFSSFLLMWFGY